jgi:CheY-like chemotaxis protein
VKILVADDNRSIPKKVEEAVKGQGHEVVGVGHGEAAVKKLAEFAPDLVLADVFMPVRNGYEVCDYVKNNEKFAHIPVVLMVGAFDPIDQHEVKRVRADGVLMKPFDPPDNLLKMIEAMTEKAKAPAEEKAARAPVGDTQQLSADEMKRLTHKGVEEFPAPEPEPEEYAVRPARIEFEEGTEPAAFSEMLAPPTETEEEGPKAVEEEKPRAEAGGFRASAVPDIEFVGEEEEEEKEAAEAPAPAAAEAPSWGALEMTPEEPARAAPEEAAPAEPEAPQWGGIEAPPREPSPDEPPIKVEFAGAEPLELVTEESPAEGPTVAAAGPVPELATSATEFMEMAAGAGEPSAPVVEEAFSIPIMEEIAAPPIAAAAVPPPAVEAAEPTPSLKEIISEAMRAPEPIPLQPLPVEIPAGARPVEISPEAAAIVSEAPAYTGDTDAFARPHMDPAAVDAIVEKVIARLQKGVLDQITRDILRPIVEALVAREMERKP